MYRPPSDTDFDHKAMYSAKQGLDAFRPQIRPPEQPVHPPVRRHIVALPTVSQVDYNLREPDTQAAIQNGGSVLHTCFLRRCP